jgi:hypothetical protein
VSALVFTPTHNAHGKADASEFQREARLFCASLRADKGWSVPVHRFDNTADLAERRAHVLRHVHGLPPGSVKAVAFFCHGYPDGLQAGFRSEHVKGLARELENVAATELTVALYACSAGADQDASTDELHDPGPGGDGGFADRLRDELGELGVKATVFGHSNAGHCTRNPRVRIFLPEERRGGHWVVSPDSPLWARWKAFLKGAGRFQFPFMSAAEIEAELRG